MYTMDLGYSDLFARQGQCSIKSLFYYDQNFVLAISTYTTVPIYYGNLESH